MKYKCLSIAGFDGSGGAGIQADLQTFTSLGCYGMTVLTAIPVQNTCGVQNCYNIPIKCIEEQLESIFDDIIPDSIKIGMLFSIEIIELVTDFLKNRATNIPIILDPVMLAKSGDALLKKDALNSLKYNLIPITTIITPNIPEAIELVGENSDKKIISQKLLDLGCNSVLLKGGHDYGKLCEDIFLNNEKLEILSSKRIISTNTHGTGCTLSSAIASFVAKGNDLLSSCKLAKDYVYNAILFAQNMNIGKGNGPLNHNYNIK